MSMPNQNSGMEYVNIVKPSKPWSYPVPRRQPWEIPIQMPIAIDAMSRSPDQQRRWATPHPRSSC